MTVSLWEWTVRRGAKTGPVGVSMTRHGAMEALAKALVATRQPSMGQVVPMLLACSGQRQSYYVRGWPAYTADYDGQILQWRQ